MYLVLLDRFAANTRYTRFLRFAIGIFMSAYRVQIWNPLLFNVFLPLDKLLDSHEDVATSV